MNNNQRNNAKNHETKENIQQRLANEYQFLMKQVMTAKSLHQSEAKKMT